MVHQIKLMDFREYDANGCYNVQAFGSNEKKETFSVIINNFKPYFYVRVGEDWTEEDKDLFIDEILPNYMEDYCDPSKIIPHISSSIISKGKLYGFDAGKHYKFLKMEFNNMFCYKKTRKAWYKDDKLNKISYCRFATEIYESKLPPVLRIFHDYGISPCGWIEIKQNTVNILPFVQNVITVLLLILKMLNLFKKKLLSRLKFVVLMVKCKAVMVISLNPLKHIIK